MTRRSWMVLLGALSFAGVALALCGCLAVPRVPASGEIAGYSLSGPVDSEVAQDYLEGRRLPRDLAETRRRYLARRAAPSREELEQVSRRYSPDVATLLLLETLSVKPDVLALRRRYEAELAYVRRVGIEQARPRMPENLLVLLVPGWFYLANGSETNSDYRRQRRLFERWSIAHRLVPIDENGAVEDNARVVAAAIREESKRHQLFVVSASKSGAEVALALGRELRPGEADAVLGWLSLVGVVRGSPLADRMLEPDLCWLAKLKLAWDGYDLAGAWSMRTVTARPAFDRLSFPPHLQRFAYVAVPLSGHVTGRGSGGYRRMRELGPNDGLTLLADELLPGGVALLAPGSDHFLAAEDPDVWSTALFRLFADELRERVR